uniref:Uncharacterized protein n=1 Tax=Anguilla anguilla TaxID=7936 RepID=A0A0E9XMG6_ANGAN
MKTNHSNYTISKSKRAMLCVRFPVGPKQNSAREQWNTKRAV